MLVKVNGEFVEIEKKSNIEDLLVFLDIPYASASSPEEGTID